MMCAIGCGGPTRIDAHGYVVFADGEPVKNGRIEFRSTTDKWRGTSEIDTAGHFRLMGDLGEKGIPAGEYEAIVVQLIITEDLSLAEHGHGRPVPRRYADYYTSGLKLAVSLENSNNLKVILENE